MRTFYEASAAEEEDRRRRRSCGDSMEDSAVDVRSGPFHLRAILRVRAAGGGERDRSAGISEHTDRASDVLRRERASVVVGTGVALLLQRESEWCRKDKIQTHIRDNNMRL
jgi:hypothetical protein